MLRFWMVWLALGLLAAFAGAEPAAVEFPAEAWEVLYMRGARVGYSHTRLDHPADRPDLVEARIEEHMTMRRLGQRLHTVTLRSSLETMEGRPISFAYESQSGEARTVIRGRIEGSELEYTVENAGQSASGHRPWDPAVKFPYASAVFLQGQALETGRSFSYSILSPALGLDSQTLTWTVEGRQEVTLLDERKTLWKVRIDLGPLVSYAYMDDAKETWKAEVPSLELVSLRATRELALAPVEVESSPDVLISSAVRPNLRFYRPRQVNWARYKIRRRDGRQVTFPGDSQQVLGREGDWTLLEVDPSRLHQRELDLAPYLQSNSYLHCTHPDVQAIVQDVAGGAASAEQAAEQLRTWVRQNITAEGAQEGFASDLECLANRRGDCTEQAVLLASLCRSRQIPARIATGIVASSGLFMGHCWAEVYLNGAWKPLDAALGTGPVDATHIKLSDSSLNQPGVQAELGNTMGSLGQLELEVVAYQEQGRNQPREPLGWELAGTTLTWPRLGLELQVPGAFQVLPPDQTSYPACLTLQAASGRQLNIACEEYSGRSFTTLVDQLGGGLASPRVPRTIDGRRAVVVIGGPIGRQDLSALVDRGDTYLSLQLLDADPGEVEAFMGLLTSLRLREP